jgi:hypothetical protein
MDRIELDFLISGLIAGLLFSIYLSIRLNRLIPVIINGDKRSHQILKLIKKAACNRTFSFILHVWLIYGLLYGVILAIGLELGRYIISWGESGLRLTGGVGLSVSALMFCTISSMVLAVTVKKYAGDRNPAHVT